MSDDFGTKTYSFEEAILLIKKIKKTKYVILGGDVLEQDGCYTYINWYCEPTAKATATSESCRKASGFIYRLANHEKYLYVFVISTYERYVQLQSYF